MPGRAKGFFRLGPRYGSGSSGGPGEPERFVDFGTRVASAGPTCAVRLADFGEVEVITLMSPIAPGRRELIRGDTSFSPEELRPERPARLFFLAPPGSVELNYGKLATVATELPWLGMAYVAAAARQAGHHVYLKDYEATRQGYDAVARDIREIAPDAVLMANFVTNSERCLKVAQVAKSINPNIKVILGGPQPTIFPEETIQSALVDAVTYSEAEISLCQLVRVLHSPDAWKDVPGIVRRENGNIVLTPRQPLIDDLDSIPMPALDLYPMHRYYPAIYIRGRRVGNYVTSRGCPYECTYCEAKMTFGRTFRFHSTERVIDDIKYMTGKYGFDSYQFYDDIFTTNRKRVLDLCEGFLRADLKIQWMCWTRTNLVDRELLSMMKRAGCYLIFFGCETGNQEMLDRIKKALTVEQNHEGIALVTECGLKAFSSFMLGLPGETREQSEQTIQFALKSKLNYAIFYLLEPYPGTEIWADALENGHFIADPRYRNNLLTNFDKVWVPNGRTRKELVEQQQRAMRVFYLRPKIILDWLSDWAHLGLRRLCRGIVGGIKVLIIDQLPFFKRARRTDTKRYA